MIRPANPRTRSLAELAEFLGLYGQISPEYSGLTISGVCSDSRAIEPGDIFVALPGEKSHGCAFLTTALERGARAVLTDLRGDEIASRISGAFPRLVVPKPRSICGPVANWFYDNPSSSIFIAGITGTNGKTTTTYLLQQIWREAGRKSGLIGTVEINFAGHSYPASHTTPESDALQRLLATMKEDEVGEVAMEVSSHSLVQERVKGTKFSVVGFTNLSQDHLDYHGDMEGYFQAKKSLFSPEYSETALITIDSSYGERLWQETEIGKYSLSVTGVADWHFASITERPTGFDLLIRGPGGISIENEFHLIGRHNLENLLLAVASAFQSGIDPVTISNSLPALRGAPGRLERVPVPEIMALVDYAHTPDAVTRALASVRPSAPGRIIAVLGCGGDRDTSKRPLMGSALNAGADIPIFTSDNPRSEDPNVILTEMTDGVALRESAEIILDRRDAIRRAIELAQPGDLVIVLGKGHETGQEVMGEKRPFSDREEIILAAKDKS